jgi:hypothetical protein
MIEPWVGCWAWSGIGAKDRNWDKTRPIIKHKREQRELTENRQATYGDSIRMIRSGIHIGHFLCIVETVFILLP